MSPESIMGAGASGMPDYNAELERRLDETIILTGLDPKHRLDERTHRLIRELPGTKVRTNRDLLGLYIAGAENIAERAKGTLPSLEKDTLHHIENYLVATGILPVAYIQSTSRKGLGYYLKQLIQHIIRFH